jgi:hypothetical protein
VESEKVMGRDYKRREGLRRKEENMRRDDSILVRDQMKMEKGIRRGLRMGMGRGYRWGWGWRWG